MPHPTAPDAAAPHRIFLVYSHTHWDREWYLPFHEYRLRLTEMAGGLLDLLENDQDFRCFHFDGHSAVIDDHLEMHPEDEERVRAQVQAGRLLMGPWYILPDEFLVSGESLVRNLLLGRRIARRFGEPMPVGYLPDQFGHVGQIPQILRGFGLDSAVIWRGVADPVDGSEFWWEAPDGSGVLTVYLRHGYAFGHELPEEPQALAERLTAMRAALEPLAATPYVLIPNGADHAFPQRNLSRVIAEANRNLEPGAVMVHGSLPELICGIKRHVGSEGAGLRRVRSEFRSGRRTPRLPGVLSARLWIKQRNAACETLLERWAEPFAAFQALEHAAGERLPGEAERRRDWARNALRQAWKYLLQNQPHDSICGCSIDQVHDEMRPRFDWVDQIGGRVTERSLTEIAALANTELPARHGERMRPLVVFNPSSRDRTDFVTVRLHVPRHEQFAVTDHCGRSLPSQVIARRQTELFSTEVQRAELTRVLAGMPGDDPDAPERFAAWALHRAHATDAGLGLAGASVADGPRHESARLDLTVEAGRPHDLGAAAEALNALRSLADRQAVELLHLRVYRPDQEEVELGFLAPDVPGHGYRTVAVVEQGDRVAAERPSMVPALTLPHTHDQASPVRIENDLLAVEVDAQDGTLTLTDKLRCAQYAGFVRFEDRGDAGDEYNFSPPKRDRAIGGYAEPPEVRLVESGPARWTVRIAGVLRLPVGLASQRRCRSAATIDCPAVTSVSLSPGVARVDIRTEVDNRAEDHRLRVLFPTGIQAETAAAESHFGVTERPLALPAFGPDWTEDPVGTFPQKTFVDVTDGFRGLAVANRGLPEYEVMPTEAGAVIALTLLRCVGWLSRDDLATRRGYAGPARETPGAQMLGRQTFEYALIPHGGDWEAALGAAHDFTLPLRAAPTGLHSGPLPSAHQFIRITPPSVVVSAVKLAENGDGLMVRLYNPTARSVEAIIAIAWPLAAAHLTDMEEHPGERLEVATDGRSVGVTLGPSKIVTVRLTMG